MTTPTEAPASTLLRLPGELRNRIYIYVFSGQEIYPTMYYDGIVRCRCMSAITGFYTPQAFDLFIALTRTCRQIREETRLLPYKYSDYYVNSDTADFLQWLWRLDNKMRMTVKAALTEEQKRVLDTSVCYAEKGKFPDV